VLGRAKMTENGQLTPAFSYLQSYVEGLEWTHKKNLSIKKGFL
jgi:hypothetical protein